jgi:carboxypeptidase PM20D1
LFIAASDSRHFLHLCEQVFRFNPVVIGAHETSMFHGVNERIAVDTQAKLVLFIRQLVLRVDDRSPEVGC